MTTYIAARHIRTKAQFKKEMKDGVNIRLFDPSIVRGSPVVYMRDFQDREPGFILTVTNERRSWFAQIEVIGQRKMRVT